MVAISFVTDSQRTNPAIQAERCERAATSLYAATTTQHRAALERASKAPMDWQKGGALRPIGLVLQLCKTILTRNGVPRFSDKTPSHNIVTSLALRYSFCCITLLRKRFMPTNFFYFRTSKKRSKRRHVTSDAQ